MEGLIVTKQNSNQYSWGDNCLGWHFVDSPSLSIIQEFMPPNTQKVLHFHHKSQQFFYILKGVATFTIENEELTIKPGEGIHMNKGKKHQIKNISQQERSLMVISEPHSHGDRDNL